MYFAINRFTGNGTTTQWELNFTGGYIDQAHVKVLVTSTAGVKTIPTFTWVNANTVSIVPAVANGSTIELYRDTPKGLPLVDYTDGAIINERNLDKSAQQAVFVAAETADRLADVQTLVGTAASDAAASAASALASQTSAATSAASASNSATSAAASAALVTDAAAHAARTDNPHVTTKLQVGLGNVDNTADLAKPVSTAQAQAIADASAAVRSDLSSASTSLGVSLVGGALRVVDSIAALRGTDKTKNSRVRLIGYSTAGDGWVTDYWMDPSDTTSADTGGSVIVGADGGRWKLNDPAMRNARGFGAKGDGVANDGPSLRALVSSLGTLGGGFRLASGTYRIDAPAGSAMSMTAPVSVLGDGGVYTAINPNLAADTDNTVSVIPSAAVDPTLLRLSGFSLHDPATGTRKGNHGLYLDTQTAGSQLPKFTLRDVIVGSATSATGWGVLHLNSPANNINGGMYAALIENNAVKGGIKLENSGDSLSVVHNVLSGANVGVWAALVSGASLLEIQANNITNSGGAIRIESGARFRVTGNNIEHLAAGAVANNNSAVVNIAGGNGVIHGGVIKENLVSAFGSTDASTLIRLRNCRGTVVEDNVLLSGGPTTTVGIDVGADCQDVRVGPNTFNAGVTSQVVDAGVGTMGVVKTLPLQNGWVAFGVGQATLKHIKTSDGIVHLYGSIKDGTTTNGVLIATLPAGHRPSEIIRAGCFTQLAGTPSPAELTIETDGSVRLSFAKSEIVDVNITFPAANLSNAVSIE